MKAVTMANMKAHSRARWIWFAVSGVFVAWAGGFLLSSGNDRCVDGPNIHECSGRFASGAWHGVGLVSIIVGLVMVIAALAMAARTRYRRRLTAH